MAEDSGTMALTPLEPKATGMLANLMSGSPGKLALSPRYRP